MNSREALVRELTDMLESQDSIADYSPMDLWYLLNRSKEMLANCVTEGDYLHICANNLEEFLIYKLKKRTLLDYEGCCQEVDHDNVLDMQYILDEAQEFGYYPFETLTVHYERE